MGIRFNPAQEEAICARCGNILVSAGAGSGKTTVLVEHVIQRLREGGAIDRLLILTFTQSAADEMRSRIGQALAEMSAQEPNDFAYRCQLALLPQADIGTIHSFCLSLLRKHYDRLGLPAGVKVASDLEIAALQRKVMEEFLEDAYADTESGLRELADAYGGVHDDRELVKLLQDLYAYSLSRPDPEGWLRQCAVAFTEDTPWTETIWGKYLLSRLKGQVQGAKETIRQIQELCLESDIPLLWQQLAQEDKDKVEQVLAQTDGEAFFTALQDLSFSRLPSGKKQLQAGHAEGHEFDPDILALFKNLRQQAKDEIDRCRKKMPNPEPPEIRKALAWLAEKLVEAVIAYGDRFIQEKRRKGWVDYHDMEHLALALLQNEEAAKELQDAYDAVLVDEYQDVNEVQEAIFQKIAAKCLFAVGDVKQSIYRFRLAEPRLFLAKYDTYGQGTEGRRIDLNDNYRSHRSIINGINHVFRQIMSRETAEVEYDQKAMLTAGSTQEGQPPELWLIQMENKEPEITPLMLEARCIAQRIGELRKEGYAFGDMAILLRSVKSSLPVLMGELRAQGIPVSAGGGGEWLQSSEMLLIHSLLNIVDNPRQDIPLTAALRSPLFGFTEEKLLQIRKLDKDILLFDALLLAKEDPQVSAFLQQLAVWRRLAAESPLPELLLDIYDHKGLYHLVGALPEGERRQENLMNLYAMACAYQQGECAGLYRFLCLLEDSAEQERKGLGTASDNAVRVMSIHKSKGLEFPVVFLADCCREFNFRDEYGDVIWERSFGLGMRYDNRRSRIKRKTISHAAVAGVLHQQSLAEEMRVAYVAMTRAKERLILTACQQKLQEKVETWARPLTTGWRLPEQVLQRATCPLDWYGPALCRRDIPSPWQIYLISGDDLAPMPAVSEERAPLTVPEDLQQQVNAVLDWSYPQREHCNDPVKWSVSTLNRMQYPAEEREQVPLHPLAVSPPEKEGQATNRGSAYHRVLQLLDFTANSSEAIQQQITQMVEKKKLKEEAAQMVDPQILSAFCQSELGQRMAKAEILRREEAFTILLADDLLVQGILDAAFLTGDGWVLVDYKTGGKGKTPDMLRQQYQRQMDCYGEAIQRLWGKPVAERWLYFLDLGCALAL